MLAERLRVGGAELDGPVSRLSTDERQRLALLRALVLDSPVLLVDEPRGPLDPASVAQVESIPAKANVSVPRASGWWIAAWRRSCERHRPQPSRSRHRLFPGRSGRGHLDWPEAATPSAGAVVGYPQIAAPSGQQGGPKPVWRVPELGAKPPPRHKCVCNRQPSQIASPSGPERLFGRKS